MGDGAGVAVPRLMDRVDRKRGAVREQRCAAVAVEGDERVPEVTGVLRQLSGPLRVPALDRLGRRTVVEPWCLRAEARALRRDLQARLGDVAIEGVEAER